MAAQEPNMADEMETDAPNKTEADTVELENENCNSLPEKMEEDNGRKDEQEEDMATDNDATSSDPNYLELVGCHIKKRVAREFAKLIVDGKLSLSDIDERSKKSIANLKAEDGVQFARHLGQMISKRSGMEETGSRQGFLKRQLAMLLVQLKKHNRAYLQEPVGGPDKEKIDKLLEKTGYTLSCAGSQRIYGGPPPDWEGDEPICNNSVYISGLPHDMFEDELVPILERCGKIWVLRLMVSPLNNFPRGFCFLMYCTQEEAQCAVEQLNNLELRDGHVMRANLNHAHSTLFVKSLPNDKTDQEIRDEFGSKTEGLINIRVLCCTSCPEVEGIPHAAFLSFSSQRHLSVAKRALGKGETLIFGARVDVSQADARGKPEDDCLNKVTEVHVHDMPDSLDTGKLQAKFGEYGEVKRVSKAGDHAIVFFVENQSAVKAMVALKGTWRQTSTIFYTRENGDQTGSNGASATAVAHPYLCSVETGLGQEFGKIIIDVSMGVPRKKSAPEKKQQQQKANNDLHRRGGSRGRPGRVANNFAPGRGGDRGRRGLLPLPVAGRQPPFRGAGGLMPPPPFGYGPADRSGYADHMGGYRDRTGYANGMDYDYYQHYTCDRFGLESGYRNEGFRRFRGFDDFGDYQPQIADHWRDRWGDFDLPAAVGPRGMGRGGWNGQGSFPHRTLRGQNKHRSAPHNRRPMGNQDN